MVSISSVFRYMVRRTSEAIPRAREGTPVMMARLLFAAPLYLPIIAYMLNPGWMTWAALSLPNWLRWLGAAIGLAMLPLLYWVFRSIGSNISETTLTKKNHRLVTHGPFQWVRHPLYSAATVVLVSMSILAANWFMLMMACIALIGIVVLVIPREEKELIRKFGAEYQDYMRRTGRLAPRLFR
jgi:protein-S-isoprenylcysteine O-methyltransferase Ste14